MKKKCFSRHIVFLLVCFTLFGPCMLWAEETSSNVFDLGEVVVRDRSETITQVGSVESIDMQQIEMTNARNVSDALNTLPGVSISAGGRKAESSINVRGFGTRYVPIFLDGIPLYIPYDGYVDSGNLTTDNISRIDISKGVSSVLYGFNTMGGVVNMVSRKPREAFEGSYRLEYAGGETLNGNLNIGTSQEKYYLTLGLGFTDSDGMPLADDFEPNKYENGGNRDNSDLKEWNAAVKIGFTPAPGHEYAIGYQTIRKEKGLPPSADPEERRAKYWRFTDWDKQTLYFIGNTKMTENLSFKTRLFRDEYYNVLDSYDDDTYSTQTRRSSFHSTYDDYSYGGSIIARTTYIPKNTLSMSFHYKRDVHEDQNGIDGPWGSYEQDMYSFGIEDDIKLTDNLAVVIGAGYDIQDPKKSFNGETSGAIREAKSAFNPQIGVLWTTMADLDIHFSVGKKTRWPTLNELYSDGLDGDVKPNPNLKEETSTNWELGFEKPLPNYNTIGLTFFYSDVKDMIDKVDIVDPVYDEQQQNIDDSRFQGIEFQFTSKSLPNNTFQLHYTYTDAENQTSGADSKHLNNIPEHNLYISDHYAFNDMFAVFGSAEYNSDRYDDDANWNQAKIDGFWVANFKVIASINKLLNIEVGVKNIFDENYMMEFGSPQAGRTFFVGVNGKF